MDKDQLDLWRRYRTSLALAVPVGAVLGALIGIAFYLSSDSETRAADRVLGWISYTVTLGTGIGAATAAVAAAGATANVLLHARLPTSNTTGTMGQVAVGAGCSVAATCSVLGAVIALTTGSGWPAASGWVISGVMLGLAAGIAAALTSALAPHLERRRDINYPQTDRDRPKTQHQMNRPD